MSFTLLRLAVLASALALVSGCGGGSGSSSGNGGSGGGVGSPATVTFSFTGGTPTAVATQIGTGAFSSVTPSASVSLTTPSGTTKFAVAYVCQSSLNSGGIQYTSTNQYVIEASTLDGTSFSEPCTQTTTSNADTGTLTGSVDASAISGANYIGVIADDGTSGSQNIISGSSANFTLTVPAGTDRVAVAGYDIEFTNQPGSNSTWTLSAVRNIGDVAVPGALNSGTAVTLGASDAVTPQPITYNNVASGYPAPTTYATYNWSGNGEIELSITATTQYPAVPAAAAESGDYYSFQSSTYIETDTQVLEEVLVNTNTSSNGPLAVAFPAPWTYAGPTPSAQPVFDISGSGLTGKTGFADAIELDWSTGTENANQFTTTTTATGNYLNGSTTLTFPALSGLSGFLSTPPSGNQVYWFASATASTVPSLQSLSQNATIKGVLVEGVFQEP